MKIKIVGAAGGEVTGSAYYVQTKQAGLLVDCGLFQGGKKAEALKMARARRWRSQIDNVSNSSPPRLTWAT